VITVPWHIEKGGGTCGDSQWAVIKDDDGSTAGCHDTQDEAEAQLAALYAQESETNAMTDLADLRAAAAEARRAAARSQPLGLPCGIAQRDDEHAPMPRWPSRFERAKKVERDGQQYYLVEGYASVFERGYEMWDLFGPYTEIVSVGAADETLEAAPEVVYRLNHSGMAMARSTNGRLELWADETGLGDRAWLNPKRADVKDLVTAIEDGDMTEQSFMFTITSGRWSPDYLEYRIDAFDLERGDVGPVTYGANPRTTVAARSGEFVAAVPYLPPLAARVVYQQLQQRYPDLGALPAQPADRTGARELAKQGRPVAFVARLLESDE
jgi:phage head maturation protease